MNKSLIFSDLHLHRHRENHERLQDCLNVLEWVFKTALEQKCQRIFFLGDLYHERSKIDVLNYLRTFECFMKHANQDLEVYLLIGNHDMYHKERWDVNSVQPLTAIRNVTVIDKPTTLKFGKTNVDFLPHTEHPMVELEKLKKGRKKSELQVLLGHLAVHGAELNKLFGTKADVIVEYDNDMVPVTADIFDDWKMTFLGHYHGAQHLNDKVEYVGSPLQLTFGEAFQKKHIIVLDMDTLEKKYIENTFSPKHYILHAEDLDKYDLKDQFVSVSVKDMGSKEVVDVKKALIEKHNVASYDIRPKDKKDKENQDSIDEAKAILMNHDEMLDMFIEKKGVPSGLDIGLLKQIGKQLCQLKG